MTLVRHGETEWNLSGRQQGHLDSPLTPRGLAQARAVAAGLDGTTFTALYSSDLGRALTTARVIGERLGLPVRSERCLRERHLGILQGQSKEEFRERQPAAAAELASGNPDFVLPGGESARGRYERVVGCLAGMALRHTGGELLVVCHGGGLDSVFRRALALPLEQPRRFSLMNGSINVVEIDGDEWRVTTWGSVAHLGAVAALDDQ